MSKIKTLENFDGDFMRERPRRNMVLPPLSAKLTLVGLTIFLDRTALAIPPYEGGGEEPTICGAQVSEDPFVLNVLRVDPSIIHLIVESNSEVSLPISLKVKVFSENENKSLYIHLGELAPGSSIAYDLHKADLAISSRAMLGVGEIELRPCLELRNRCKPANSGAQIYFTHRDGDVSLFKLDNGEVPPVYNSRDGEVLARTSGLLNVGQKKGIFS